MSDFLLIAILIFQIFILVFLVIRSRNKQSQRLLNEDFALLRREISAELASLRKESQSNLTQQFALVLDSLDRNSRNQSDGLKDFGKLFQQNVESLNKAQKEKLTELNQNQRDLLSSTELRLEKIRETVDEKLQKTLEARLGQSFEMVNKQLQAVQQGLGEMQNLAQGVGDLKKVLTNVKSRGILGEFQLQAILENVMSPEQYLVNTSVLPNSRERVEFAIKMPGDNHPVLLPIDSKFPQESYLRLVDAYESTDNQLINAYRLELFQSVKKAASDIRNKYVQPPHSTDFAILFLPMESLYAELLREPGFVQKIQMDYQVVITGPTTLTALLNSLQMGFKTLAIQKRSSEVWQILGAVKTEFSKFGDLLDKTQRKLNEANSELDKLIGTRTRAIQRKLKDVEEITEDERSKLLD
ncbi:DNA recombination protein RmuC [Algoriphagus sediminis]|uniref:DNA recombination protein RmuC n=1 Tax=Algoriphagus sediminis TaxID=3057113 RepID=A0ABT7YDM7_9BACT|nr:DNA recombination protein RmuC [Algoriphagus sediminis]MDN3204635.1 DNA recombination protein RmuC [Algoriphagus sediminis]